jgi:hypothetical protein
MEVEKSMGAISYAYFGNDDEPVTHCYECEQDLTEDGGISLVLSINGKLVEVESCLDADGRLEDTVDGAVANGFHSETCCGGCGESLGWMTGVNEVRYDE